MASLVRQRLLKRQIKLSEQIQLRFLKRLHRFLLNGYPLLEALEAIKWDKELEETANNFIEALKDGTPIDTVFEKTGFHQSISSFLYFIRANSNLVESVGKCAEMYEHRMKNTKQFKQILRYPLILLVISSLVIFFINHNVLPSFQSLLQSSAEAQTTIMVSSFIMNLFEHLFIIGLMSLVIASTIWQFVKKKIEIDQQIKIFNRIPIYRNFLRLQNSFQFATHFSSLLKAGLSLKEILQELTNQNKLPIISFYSNLMTNDLNRGFHISSLLSELVFIEKQLAIIFQKNTDISALEKDLGLYSEMLMEEMQRKVIQVITLIQPIFYILLGSFIVFIYISLMWPMFQLINTL